MCWRKLIFIAGMVWQGDEHKNKYHLVNWKTYHKPRDLDGLGILNLDIMNKALLAKWFSKLENETRLWQTILLGKYVPDDPQV